MIFSDLKSHDGAKTTKMIKIVKIENNEVFVELPNAPELDAILGTNGLRVQKSDCIDIAADALKVPVRGSSSKKVMSTTALRAETDNSTSTES